MDGDMTLHLDMTADSSDFVSGLQAGNAALADTNQEVALSKDTVDKLTAAISGLTGTVPGITAALKAEADAHDHASQSTSKHAETLKNMDGIVGQFASDFTTHFRSISAAADAMGLSVGASVARMSAFGNLLTGLGDAVPGIVALAAGVVGIFAAFELGKDAVTSASELQDSMSRLGQIVKDQGGNWAVLSQQVKAFAEAQVSMTTYSETAVINSLERLVASGMSLSDAMTTTRVAEDLAAASGRSLEEATNSLIEAEHGRLMGLEAMGVLTRQQVKDGMTFDEVLQQIETHMGGAAQAATLTFSGSMSQLHSTVEKLMDDLGTPLLGVLAQVAKGFTGIVSTLDDQLQPSFKALSDWAAQQIPAVKEWFAQLTDTVTFLGHEFRDVAGSDGAQFLRDQLGQLGTAIDNIEGDIDNGKTGWTFLRDIMKQVGDAAKDLIGFLQGVADKLDDMEAAQDRFGRSMNAFWNSDLGKRISGGLGGVGMNPALFAALGPLGPLAEVVGGFAGNGQGVGPYGNGFAGAPNETSGVAPRYSGSGGAGAPTAPPWHPSTAYNPTIGGPSGSKAGQPAYDAGPDIVANYHDQTDALQQLNEQLAQLPKTMDGYNQALTILDPLVKAATVEHQQLNTEFANAKDRLTVATDDYNTYKDSLQGVSKLTVAQKEQLKEYQDAQREAQQQVDALSSAYDKNRSVLQGLTKDQQAARDAIQKMADDWMDFVSDTDQKSMEDLATFKMTNAQKATYYRNIVDQLIATNQQFSKQFNQAYTAMAQAGVQAFEEIYHAEQQFVTEATQHMASFAEAIIVDHQTMASAIRTVYQDIEKWFLDMLAQMIAKALVALPIIQAVFGGGSSPFGAGSAYLPGVGWGLGVTSNAVGGSGLAPNAVGSNIAALASSPSIASAMSLATSASGGGSVGSGSYGTASPMDFGWGAGGSAGGFGNPSASGGASGGGFTSSGYNFGPSTSGAVGGGMMALLAHSGLGSMIGTIGALGLGGGLIGDMAFGNKGFSAIGGALGGLGVVGLQALLTSSSFGSALGGFLAAGPAGWGILLGSILLGSLAGSLFGDHFSQADEPDIYNPDYGPALADMQGSTAGNPMNAGGRQYVMDSQTSQATGGRGWNLLMEQFVQQFRGNLQWLPADLRDAFPQIEALWGGATDKAFFNPDGKNGYLDIGSGKRALWSDFWAQITAHGQEISQLMQSMTTTEMYVASVNGGLQSVGTQSSGPSGGASGNPFAVPSPGAPSNAIASGGAGKAGGLLAERLGHTISVIVNQHNSSSLISNTNMERTIQDAVARALPFAMEELNAG